MYKTRKQEQQRLIPRLILSKYYILNKKNTVLEFQTA